MAQITEETIDTPSGPLTYLLRQPSVNKRAAAPALLLTFGMSAEGAFHDAPYDIPFRCFAEAGHYVASFDLPNHGNRVDQYGAGIEGLRNALLAGQDPFRRFVRDGQAVIDGCLAQGIDVGQRVVLCGVSRAGYCALRLAAAEPRISAVAALAPVTDWRRLQEFAAVKEQPATAALALADWATALADRAIYIAIGNHDQRVGTDTCLGFAHQLFAAAAKGGFTQAAKQVHVVDSPGHTLADEWRWRGARFLLQRVDESGSG